MEENNIALLTNRLLKVTEPEPDDIFTNTIMQKVARKEQTYKQLSQIKLYIAVFVGTLVVLAGLYTMVPYLSAIFETFSSPMQTLASSVENPMPGIFHPTLFLGLLALPLALYILDVIVSDILGYSIFKV